MSLTFSCPRPPRFRGASRTAVASALLGSCLLAAPAHAQTYNVSLDTSQLVQGDYSLDLQLNSGIVGLSTIDVGSFVFGGNYGASNIPPSAHDGTTGNLSHSVSLHIDSAGPSAFSSAEFTQGFFGGGSQDSFLTFQVDASQLSATGGSPDTFVFGLINSNDVNDPINGVGLLTLTNDSAAGYTVTTGGYTGRDNAFHQTMASPPSATPELGTVTSLGLLMGLFGLGALRARRGRARVAAGAE